MEILFASRKVQRLCNSEKEMRARLGARNAARLMRRLAQLEAAVTLEDIPRVPPPRCHELGRDRRGQLAVDLIHPKRLIFKPHHTPIPTKEDGGLDWSQVTAVLIVEVVDYH